MTYKTVFWDDISQSQQERDCTLEEVQEIEARQNPANLREGIIQRIKIERDRRKFNGVFVNNKWIHTDTYSRTQWLGMVMMNANLPVIEWTTMDGTTISTTPALAQAVFQATATLDATLFAFAKSLALQVNESTNPASVDVTTGWPTTFGE